MLITKKKNKNKTATILNKFFFDIITNLDIPPQYNETVPLGQNLGGPLIKAIRKYRSHLNIKTLKKKCNSDLR